MSGSDRVEKYIRPSLLGFSGYSARLSPEILEDELDVPAGGVLKLDANENPYGCSPRVNRALAAFADLNIYPDTAQTELKRLLAGYIGVGAEHIAAGSGSGGTRGRRTRRSRARSGRPRPGGRCCRSAAGCGR